MRWQVVLPGQGHAAPVASSFGPPMVLEEESMRKQIGAMDCDGFIVVGPDAFLASIAHALHEAEDRRPILPAGGQRSDVMRMFALGGGGYAEHASLGSAYPCDLGLLRVGEVETPFVAHVMAGRSRIGPLRTLGIERERRSDSVRGWRLVVANTQHVAGSTVAPKAAVMDARLDVQVFGGPLWRRAGLLRAARRGLHLGSPAVWRRQTAEMHAIVPESWTVRADGIRRGRGPFAITVAGAAFDLWI